MNKDCPPNRDCPAGGKHHICYGSVIKCFCNKCLERFDKEYDEAKKKGTTHNVHCFMCGKKHGNVSHGGGGKNVKWCEECAQQPHYCFDCFKKSPLGGGVPRRDGKSPSPHAAPSPREEIPFGGRDVYSDCDKIIKEKQLPFVDLHCDHHDTTGRYNYFRHINSVEDGKYIQCSQCFQKWFPEKDKNAPPLKEFFATREDEEPRAALFNYYEQDKQWRKDLLDFICRITPYDSPIRLDYNNLCKKYL